MTVCLRIPERFELAGREWTVERTAQVEPEDADTLGLCWPRDRKIAVTSAAEGEQALEIFAHEFVHGVLARLELPDATEERICRALEPALARDWIRAVVEEG